MRRKWKKKSVLDEMQEQKLLHIEKNSFWILYGMLVVALLVQTIIKSSVRETMGEWVCFLGVSLFMIEECVRKGVWDRYLKPGPRANLKVSLAGALVAMVLGTAVLLLRNPEMEIGAGRILRIAAIYFVITFAVTMLVLTVLTTIFRKREKRMEEKDSD